MEGDLWVRWALYVMPNACKQVFILRPYIFQFGRFSDFIRGVISVRQCVKRPEYPKMYLNHILARLRDNAR